MPLPVHAPSASRRRRISAGLLVAVAACAGLGLSATSPAAAETGNSQMGERLRQRAGDGVSLQAAYTPKGVLGIDVSSYQGNVNWASWARKGKSFAFIKATEGSSYRNPYFAAQYGGAYRAGFVRGAYHFANPAGQSGRSQARYFVRYGGAWKADSQTLPGVLDIEYGRKACYGLSQARMRSWIGAFLTEYARLTGRQAIIYTTADWWNRCTGNTTRWNKTNLIWAARWGTRTPGVLPGGWTKATFWQYSASPIDQNWFNGTRRDLINLANNVTSPPPPPPPTGQ